MSFYKIWWTELGVTKACVYFLSFVVSLQRCTSTLPSNRFINSHDLGAVAREEYPIPSLLKRPMGLKMQAFCTFPKEASCMSMKWLPSSLREVPLFINVLGDQVKGCLIMYTNLIYTPTSIFCMGMCSRAQHISMTSLTRGLPETKMICESLGSPAFTENHHPLLNRHSCSQKLSWQIGILLKMERVLPEWRMARFGSWNENEFWNFTSIIAFLMFQNYLTSFSLSNMMTSHLHGNRAPLN